MDQLPEPIRLSKILTGNDLGLLGNTENLPSAAEISAYSSRADVKKLFDSLEGDSENLTMAVHLAAHHLLETGDTSEAWRLLLSHHKN